VCLTEVDLLEISLVTFAANPEAKVTAVKEFDVDEDIVRQINELSDMLKARRLTQERN
jgi:phage head maturation protease